MTFAELKVVLDKLTPEQLTHEVVWWSTPDGLELSGTLASATPLGGDHVFDGHEWTHESGYIGFGEPERRIVEGTPVLHLDVDDAEDFVKAWVHWMNCNKSPQPS